MEEIITEYSGSVLRVELNRPTKKNYSARLDGSGERNFLYAQGNLTGIAYTEI
jgi:hypothetical protein